MRVQGVAWRRDGSQPRWWRRMDGSRVACAHLTGRMQGPRLDAQPEDADGKLLSKSLASRLESEYTLVLDSSPNLVLSVSALCLSSTVSVWLLCVVWGSSPIPRFRRETIVKKRTFPVGIAPGRSRIVSGFSDTETAGFPGLKLPVSDMPETAIFSLKPQVSGSSVVSRQSLYH